MKKNDMRLSISFNREIPKHKRAAEHLNKLGRKKADEIANVLSKVYGWEGVEGAGLIAQEDVILGQKDIAQSQKSIIQSQGNIGQNSGSETQNNVNQNNNPQTQHDTGQSNGLQNQPSEINSKDVVPTNTKPRQVSNTRNEMMKFRGGND